MDLVNFIKNLFCKHKSNTDKDDLKNVKIDYLDIRDMKKLKKMMLIQRSFLLSGE